MSQSGVRVRTMSHKCGKYESEWSRCEKKKQVCVNHNIHYQHQWGSHNYAIVHMDDYDHQLIIQLPFEHSLVGFTFSFRSTTNANEDPTIVKLSTCMAMIVNSLFSSCLKNMAWSTSHLVKPSKSTIICTNHWYQCLPLFFRLYNVFHSQQTKCVGWSLDA